MDSTLTTTLPAPGQLALVRHRHYVVTNIQQSTLPPMPLAGTSLLTQQHLVLLRSVEDDALGEELEVIWVSILTRLGSRVQCHCHRLIHYEIPWFQSSPGPEAECNIQHLALLMSMSEFQPSPASEAECVHRGWHRCLCPQAVSTLTRP